MTLKNFAKLCQSENAASRCETKATHGDAIELLPQSHCTSVLRNIHAISGVGRFSRIKAGLRAAMLLADAINFCTPAINFCRTEKVSKWWWTDVF